MKLLINGENRTVQDVKTLRTLLQSLDISPNGVVIEHNQNVVSRQKLEEVLLQEAHDVLAAGADCLQFDDPMLGYFVDPKYREQRSEHWGTGQFSDVDAELRLGVESVNRLAGPLRQRGAHEAEQQDPEHDAAEPGGASAHRGEPQHAAENQHDEAGDGKGEVRDA